MITPAPVCCRLLLFYVLMRLFAAILLDQST